MKTCRECGREVSALATVCPNCGAPYPAREKWDGWGYEFISPITVLGLPLVHISFKYNPNKAPVVARGIIAIGQFAVGYITIAQFGVGFISISQFGVGVVCVSQFALALYAVAQIGLCAFGGFGHILKVLF